MGPIPGWLIMVIWLISVVIRHTLRFVNWFLGLIGLALVPRRSIKSLIEYSNALEINRPVGPSGALWIRDCADVMSLTDTDRNSETVKRFRRERRGL